MRAAVMRVAAVPTGRDRQREAKHEPSENYSGTESRNGYTEPSNLFCDLSKLPPDVAGIWFHISMLIHLHFHGPFSVCSETDDVLANCPLRSGTGIYLWAVKQLTDVYRTSYLGETSESFYGRTKEHVVQTLGGNYRVIDPDQMCKGIQQVIWDGLWRRNTRDKLPSFLSNYESFAPLVKRYLFAQVIFVAPLECELRLQRRVEGALAQHLRSLPEASSLLPVDIRFIVRRVEESAVAVSVSADAEIEGLPQEILA